MGRREARAGARRGTTSSCCCFTAAPAQQPREEAEVLEDAEAEDRLSHARGLPVLDLDRAFDAMRHATLSSSLLARGQHPTMVVAIMQGAF